MRYKAWRKTRNVATLASVDWNTVKLPTLDWGRDMDNGCFAHEDVACAAPNEEAPVIPEGVVESEPPKIP